MESSAPENHELESLETPETDGTTGQAPVVSAPAAPGTPPSPKSSKKKLPLRQRFQDFVTHINIYLLLFALILVIAAVGVVVSIQRNEKEQTAPTINTQELTQEDLNRINETETKVGDPKQTLSIESNAIFAGKVLVRDSLDVAGTIKVGGALNLPGITVSGTSSFDQLQANRISSAGDGSFQGTLSVQRGLTVAGGGTFGGPVSAPQLSVQSLQLSGDLTFTRHIDAGGANPSSANGTALGAGGTASVSGTDTAGTIAINTGGSPGAGCFVTINFATRYNATPHIVVTPVGSAGAGLGYYINRSTANFSLCTTTPAPGGANFAFDYIVID